MTDLPIWHSTSEGIALLAKIDRRPRMRRAQDRYGDWHADYAPTGKVRALTSYWAATCIVAEPTCASPLQQSPNHVLGAVFGDPMGVTFKTHWDTSSEWAALRDALCATAMERGHVKLAARIARRQKESLSHA